MKIIGEMFDATGNWCGIYYSRFQDRFVVNVNTGQVAGLDYQFQGSTFIPTPCPKHCWVISRASGIADLNYVKVSRGGQWVNPGPADIDSGHYEDRLRQKDTLQAGDKLYKQNIWRNPRRLKWIDAYPKLQYNYGYPAAVRHCDAASIAYITGMGGPPPYDNTADEFPTPNEFKNNRDLREHVPPIEPPWGGGSDSDGVDYVVAPLGPGAIISAAATSATRPTRWVTARQFTAPATPARRAPAFIPVTHPMPLVRPWIRRAAPAGEVPPDTRSGETIDAEPTPRPFAREAQSVGAGGVSGWPKL